MKNSLLLYAIAWSVGQWAMSIPVDAEVGTQTKEVLSDVVTISQKYDFDSRPWPGEIQYVVLSYSEQPELLWITGARLELVSPDGRTPASEEFLRFSCLVLDELLTSAKTYNGLFGKTTTSLPTMGQTRLLCCKPGQFQMRFPQGFGIPILSHEPLMIEAAVLNQSREEPVEVRLKWTVEYIRDQDLQRPLKPLFIRVVRADPARWTVPPGREVKRFNVTSQLALPFDTTVHYIRASLQTFGESLELRDLTTGTTLFTSRARPFPDRLGLAHIETFSSEEGMPIYKDHEYELVSTYDNTSTVQVPARASLRLYLLDTSFQKPKLTGTRPASSP